MSNPTAIPVQRLLDEGQLAPLELEVIAGHRGLKERQLTSPRIQKPGLALAAFDQPRGGRHDRHSGHDLEPANAAGHQTAHRMPML